MVAGQEIKFPGWVGGRMGGGGRIGNKGQLRPAKAGAGFWPELGNICINFVINLYTYIWNNNL